MAASLAGFLDGPLLEPALLRAATRRANALSDASRERMKPWVQAARARYQVALELRDLASRGVALDLLRSAAFFALCALQLTESDTGLPAASSRAAWEQFTARLPEAAPSEWTRVRDAFSESDLLLLEAQAASDEGELRAAAEVTVAWLLSLAEVRSPSELRRARALRIVLSGVALLAVIWAFLAYWSALSELSPS